MAFTTSDSNIHTDGDATVDVQVLRKQLGDAAGEDGHHIILIEKQVVSGDEESDD